MPYLDLNGNRCFYGAKWPVEKDPDKIVLFIHGAGGTHRHWTYQLQELGKNHLTLALDLPGHGESGGESTKEIDEYVHYVKEFCDRVIGSPFVLAGHSMGGAISMRFAQKHPDRLAGLALVGTGARLKVLPAILNTFAGGNVFKELVNYLYGKNAPSNLLELSRKDMEQVSPKVFFHDFSACNNFDIMGDVSKIKVPTLIISADEDRLTPVKFGEYLHSRITGSEMKIITGAGHMMMLEQPEQFNHILKEFFARLEIGGKT